MTELVFRFKRAEHDIGDVKVRVPEGFDAAEYEAALVSMAVVDVRPA